MAEENGAADAVHYEELALLEDQFDDADLEILRTQYKVQKPLYAKRKDLVSKIPNFWPLVFEQAPIEIDQFIQVEDSRIFAESLESIEVSRPELDSDPTKGNPRHLKIAFNFKPNDDFEDTQLVKEFWWRRASDGWAGLISEPVKIHWKSGKDLSHGLTDMAIELFKVRQKAGDMQKTDLPLYKKVKEELESWNARNTSFFTWFAWTNDRIFVTAEESEKATAEYDTLVQRRNKGEKVEMPKVDYDDDDYMETFVEVMERGEDLAVTIADELWPHAIKLFTNAQEMEEYGDDDDEMDDEDDEDGPVDIRSLVQDHGPPAKRQKK